MIDINVARALVDSNILPMITISSILPANIAHHEQLKQYLDWTLQDYIKHWHDIQTNRGRLPHLYAKVLELAYIHAESEFKQSFESIANNELRHLTLRDLLLYFTEKGDSIAINRLCSGGITTIGELMNCSWNDLKRIPYIGHTTLIKAQKYKQWIVNNHTSLIKDIHDINTKTIIPSDYNSSESVLDALHRAIKECASILKARTSNARYNLSQRHSGNLVFISNLLSLKYIQKLSFAEIAKQVNRTSWHITKSHTDFIFTLSKGVIVCKNIVLNQQLQQRIVNEIWNKKYHCPIFKTTNSTEEKAILNALGVSILKIIDDKFILIPAREKYIYAAKIHALLQVFRESISPISRKHLLDTLKALPDFKNELSDHDLTFINSIITNRQIIEETQSGNLKLHLQYLLSDEQRVARIIYDENRWMTRQEIFNRFSQIMGRPSNSVNLSNLRRYGINSSGDLLSYGHKLPPLSKFINEYAHKKRIFHMYELKDYLRNKGFPIQEIPRTYITALCLVDNFDTNHFCLKASAHLYPEYSWRKPLRNGLSNWILCGIRDLINNFQEVSISYILTNIEQRAHEEDKQPYIRQRIRNVLKRYCGKDKPFLCENEMVSANPAVFPKVNFNTLGRRGHRNIDLHEEIRKFALQFLRTRTDNCITLVDFLQILNKQHKEPITRNCCIRALTNEYLTPIPITLHNEDGFIMLRLGENTPLK